MITYIAILRGINVSGHNLIKMKDLVSLFEKMGHQNVKTYIQSGNVVFKSDEADESRMAERISENIRTAFACDVPVLVLSHQRLKHVSESNPFLSGRTEDPAKLHVTFLSREVLHDLACEIPVSGYLPDEFMVDGRSVYLFCPNGYGNTKLNNTFFEKKLKDSATTRNWRTVLELVKIGEE